MSFLSNLPGRNSNCLNLAVSIVLVFSLYAGSANAAVVSVGGTQYELDWISGSFDFRQSILEAQPFFGNDSLAFELADACKECLGVSSIGGLSGPYFVSSTTASVVRGSTYLFGTFPATVSGSLAARDVPATFAIATVITAPVPLPAAGWMLLGGLGALAAVARRRRRSEP
ncbi:MAG: VPLPA-CTERM sorting domain-containing protein [Pseudomonadota bacterium]